MDLQQLQDYFEMRANSRSRELRQSADHRYALSKRCHSRDGRLLQTAEHRNFSNQYIPLMRHFHQHPSAGKHREFSSAKNCRKESSKPLEIQLLAHKSPCQLREKRPASSKNFIGIKLKKKLQKYLLLLSLANYSQRLSYERPSVSRFKVFVGKGNNSKLIRSLFADRFWWELTQQQSQAHLVWTQRSKRKVFKRIPEAKMDNQQHQQDEVPAKRTKGRRKDKRAVCDMENILCEKDRQAIRAQCKDFQQELRTFLRRNRQEKRQTVKLSHNHLQNHRLLTNKKNLFLNLKQYCQEQHDNPFKYIPLTFHITRNTEEEYAGLLQFQEGELKKEREKLLWIVKPGENSNRGCGIQVCKRTEQVRKHIQKCLVKHPDRTFIVQRYISPYLFHRRKFDIRCFVLVTATPIVSAYFYPRGYLRTSSFEFSLKNCSNKYIHLTNDAIQKKASQYSKFQSGNKVTFQDFQKYLDLFHPRSHSLPHPNFHQHILPAIRQLVLLSIKSSCNFGRSKKEHSFQVLGYDFMLDEQLQPWLIQINTNPCLETSCEVLDDIIPAMMENAIKIAVDTVFQPPRMDEWSLKELLGCSQRLLQGNKFELIYSQIHDS